jgi:uncharacterized protein involved in type VI secretion and phage assembly
MSRAEEQAMEIIERLRNRFYGKYRGSITEVDEDTLRIKARVPAVLGDAASGWCQPCVPYAGKNVGFLFIPEPGDFVWIEFEAGDPSYPIWSGCGWRADEKPTDATPEVKVIVTKSQHKMLFDDDGETITITDPNNNKVTMDSSGISLERDGKKVVVSDSEVNINDGALEVT